MLEKYYVQEAIDLCPNEPKTFVAGPWKVVDIIPWDRNNYLDLARRYYFRRHNGCIRRVTIDKDAL